MVDRKRKFIGSKVGGKVDRNVEAKASKNIWLLRDVNRYKEFA